MSGGIWSVLDTFIDTAYKGEYLHCAMTDPQKFYDTQLKDLTSELRPKVKDVRTWEWITFDEVNTSVPQARAQTPQVFHDF